MKVGTDSVLLGAWAPIRNTDTDILDVGTGTGVVALMLAQRTSAMRHVQIDAIDIDPPSVEEAKYNFDISPWGDRLKAIHTPLQSHSAKKYDLIVSNPPYFNNSLKAPSLQRSNARHSDSLPHKDLVKGAFDLLKDGGRMVVILPRDEGEKFVTLAELYHVGKNMGSHLSLTRICRVSTTLTKPYKRVMLEFTLFHNNITPSTKVEESISLQSDELYSEMVSDFLTNR